jgi:hypothetical protein
MIPARPRTDHCIFVEISTSRRSQKAQLSILNVKKNKTEPASIRPAARGLSKKLYMSDRVTKAKIVVEIKQIAAWRAIMPKRDNKIECQTSLLCVTLK